MILIIFVACLAWTAYILACTYRNCRSVWATSPDVPVLLSVIYLGQPLWHCLQYFRPATYNDRVSIFFQLHRFQKYSWNFSDKYALHARYGKSFYLITPTQCEFVTADGTVAREILSRSQSFAKPVGLLRKLDVFGKSLASAEGLDWKRHRRLTAGAFNGQTDKAAWDEALNRAAGALSTWLEAEAVTSTSSDMAHISMGVLFQACLDLNDESGLHHPNISVDGCKSSLITFLDIISLAKKPFLARCLRIRHRNGITSAVRRLGCTLTELVEFRRQCPTVDRTDLISLMLKCECQTDAVPEKPSGKHYLTPEEIRGNLFLFLFAGHETTANTLVAIVYLLAIFPSWQEWVLQEVDSLLRDIRMDEPPSYTLFRSTKRLRAVMLETLRLYGPVLNILRETKHQGQTVSMRNEQLLIPKNTKIHINSIALHTDPDTWGPDSLEWRPSRWISDDPPEPTSHDGSVLVDESNHASMERKLFAWSDGGRVCPGKKFSQVEIVAVLIQLFRNHRVSIIAQPGQTLEQARMDAYARVQNSVQTLTLLIADPEAVHLWWDKRR
ncbi:cytochrome P450 [Aspergillus sclerotioniger CBS 115572]|uniref:Cytochrome P450 n=1 Tax=Aspergillus sclerotioniger CBS 115572 TaxID=1450535 RepID=A0A317X1L7_9EURO|nr:cytochrome P450 [Aspergillus sclerotioniger CBS 115572]PWY91492.1 cytochrome P450 [Aspergillus sclerotioniger CBS 115572]